MKKIIFIGMLLILISEKVNSQNKVKGKKQLFEGYIVWVLSKQVPFNNYAITSKYLTDGLNKFSLVSNSTVKIDICKNLRKSFKKKLNRFVDNPMNSVYTFKNDSANIESSNLVIAGTFFSFKQEDQVIMICKVKLTVIRIDSLCEEFEKTKSFSAPCGQYVQKPYFIIYKNQFASFINDADIQKLKMVATSLNMLEVVKCH